MITTKKDRSRETEPILKGGIKRLKKFNGGSVRE
jgi:hypothetical protein